MNTTEIEKLIEKYFDGQTSLAEENRIKEFFSHEQIPPHLASYADLFRYFEETGKEEISNPDFDRELLSKINGSRIIFLNPERKRLYYITSMAAGILLLCGLIFTFRADIFKNPGNQVLRDTYSDPAIAYTQAKKTLLLVSLNFNSGLEKVQDFQTFQKGLENMEKISQFDKFQPIVINPDDHKRRP
jgi:hypothetical protein